MITTRKNRKSSFSSADVTLTIPCFEAEATIGAVLAGVSSMHEQPRTVLLIDDGSSSPLTLSSSADCDVVVHEKNRGLSAARNTAIEACRTPLLASLDSDVVPDEHWLGNLVSALNTHPVCGVGGAMHERYTSGLGNDWRSFHMTQNWGKTSELDPKFLYGSNTLFKLDSLVAVGGYDERLRTHDEDRSMTESLYAAGENLWYEAGATCFHLRQDTWKTILRQYWRWHYAKGILNGDFDDPARLYKRMEIVNFGIYRYRHHLDEVAKSRTRMMLDAAIPWVFSACDLIELNMRTGEPIPALPYAEALTDLPIEVRGFLDGVVPRYSVGESRDWHSDYQQAWLRLAGENDWAELTHAHFEEWGSWLEGLGRPPSSVR